MTILKALRLLAVIALCSIQLSLPLYAQGEPETGVRQTIASQIDAFLADDGERAFSFASPSIQSIFGSSERFMRMVRQGYQPVYRPQDYRFLDLERRGEDVVQRVLVKGPDGGLVTAVYTLVEIDGRWRISGCMLERPGEGV